MRNAIRRNKSRIAAVTVGIFLISGMQSPSAHAAKMVRVNWRGPELNVRYEPGSNLVIGKKPSNSFLNNLTKSNCKYVFGFTQLGVFGASGRLMGYSGKENSKLIINQYKVVSSKWGVDEYGEDEFLLTFKCYGSLSSPVTAKSNSYQLDLVYRDYDGAKGKGFNFNEISSPNYTIAELDSVNWIVKAEFSFSDDSIWDGDPTSILNWGNESTPVTWNPAGS